MKPNSVVVSVSLCHAICPQLNSGLRTGKVLSTFYVSWVDEMSTKACLRIKHSEFRVRLTSWQGHLLYSNSGSMVKKTGLGTVGQDLNRL